MVVQSQSPFYSRWIKPVGDVTLRSPWSIKFVIANRAVRAELNGKCAAPARVRVYPIVWGSREETCLYFDGTAKPIYSAVLLHMWSSSETANSLPFLQSAFPGLIDFSSIHNEKADVKKKKKKSQRKNRNH